ncbi:MAG: hypothetical protein ABIZ81_16895 [Opitutaceae bacterium]
MGRAVSNALEQDAARALDALRRGQHAEACREFPSALASYDEALTASRDLPSADPRTRHLRGVIAMNRGNALQKLALPASFAEAVRAYTDAIAQFETLPHHTNAELRNQLGAAQLNRGHAFLASGDAANAITSFEQAVASLEVLPLADDLSYRLNLAGARTNLAHVLLPTDPARARLLTRETLELLTAHEREHPALSEMSLRTRRTLVMANGELLRSGTGVLPVFPKGHGEDAHVIAIDLVAEATDAIDDGLALARDLELSGNAHLRPLALRLFRLGAQLYRLHQPHFLAEFLLENLSNPAFAADRDFRAATSEALHLALTEIQRPRNLMVGDAGAERLLETTRTLRAARDHLSTLTPVLSNQPV